MAVHAAFVRDLFFVRWNTPSAATCAEIRATFEAGRQRNRPFHVAVVPAEIERLDAEQLRLFVELLHEIMAASAHVAVVIEARGAVGSALRAAVSGTRLAASRHYGLSIVDSIAAALVWAPGPLPSDDELALLFEDVYEPEPERRVA